MGAVRLVAQLEMQLLRRVLEALRDLPPERDEPRTLPDRIGVERLVVVDIEDDRELPVERLTDQSVHLVHERGVDGERRLLGGVVGPADRDAHRVEARGADPVEVVRAERPSPAHALRRLERIAHVDAPAQPTRLLEYVGTEAERCEEQQEEAAGHAGRLPFAVPPENKKAARDRAA